jgi:hypothetical protein
MTVLMAVLLLSGCSTVGVKERISYKDVDGGCALYRYSGVSIVNELKIPDEYEGKPVVEIMRYAISSAEYLTRITIGKNVRTIHYWAITHCPNLEEIIVDPENPYFESHEGILYNKGMTELRIYPSARTKLQKDSAGRITVGAEVVVPAGVTSIAETAFYLCGNLYKIQLPQGLESIGNYAFMKCENLTELTLPSTLKTIGVDAFSYCDTLTSVIIPASVESIGDYAFFSLYSNMSAIYLRRPPDEISLGKDWIPNKKGQVNDKVPVLYVPAE